MRDFITKHRGEILRLIVIILPMFGLGGLTIHGQQKELDELRTTVVIEQEPVEVNITQPVKLSEHDHKRTHPEFNQVKL